MDDTQLISFLLSPDVTLPAIVGGVFAVIIYTRRLLKTLGLEDAHRQVESTAMVANESVLSNLQSEVERLSKRVETLEKHVDSLSDTLANVRLLALDCYSIVLNDKQLETHRDVLLENLQKIIKDT